MEISAGVTLTPLIDTDEAALIVTDWLTMTLVLTVISAQASISIKIIGTRMALTLMALTSLAANEQMA